MERIRDLLDRTHKANNLDIRTDLQRGVFVDGRAGTQVLFSAGT